MTNGRLHDREGLRDNSTPEPTLETAALAWSVGVQGDLLHGSLVRIARIALGRIGAQLAPWLDEGLLMGQGLATLLEMSGNDVESQPLEDAGGGSERTLRRVVNGMRSRARASSWFAGAWPCRIAPLCASLAYRDDGSEEAVADDLGLKPRELAGRYTEAGLLFGISPELMLPHVRVRLANLPREGHPSDCRVLAAAVSGRPVEQRRVLTLYFQEGLSFPEIAELLELPPGRVQELYGRAAVAIRAQVMTGANGPFEAGG